MSGGSVLNGPAGYAVPLVVGAILVYVVYRTLKAPAAAVYQGAQNFDQNIGLGGFDAWVSGLFSPPSSAADPNLGAGTLNADMGGKAFGAVSPATW